MKYVVENKLGQFVKTIWKLRSAASNNGLPDPYIDGNGRIIFPKAPAEGPEVEAERYFTVVWNSAKPSRWFKASDFIPLATITEHGLLLGDIGFDFEFVKSDSDANGQDKYVSRWRME